MAINKIPEALLGFDVATQTELNGISDQIGIVQGNVSYIESFPIQTPEVNDTARIQRAFDSVSTGVMVFPHNKTLTINSSINISNKTNFRITGFGKINLSGTSVTAFNLVGTIDGLEIDHMMITGDGVVASAHKAIGNSSGQTISNVNFHDNVIQNVTVGISLEANLSGSYNKGRIYKNFLYNIVGTASGQGYGIHVSNANHITVENNFIDKAQRHSIYQAKGTNNTIVRNYVFNHRQGVSNDTILPAIIVARSSKIKVLDNKIHNSYDCCIYVAGDSVDNNAVCSEVEVRGNEVINPLNVISPIVVGEQALQTNGILTKNVIIENNYIYRKDYLLGGTIKIHNGLNIVVENNKIVAEGVNAGEVVSGIVVTHASYTATSADADNIIVKNNKFIVTGTNVANCRAITLDSPVCGNNGIRLKIEGNEYVGLYTATGKAYTEVYTIASMVNPNYFRTDAIRRHQLAGVPTSGYWNKTEYVENTNPSELGTAGSKYIVYGWKRITTGSGNVLNTDWFEDRHPTGN